MSKTKKPQDLPKPESRSDKQQKSLTGLMDSPVDPGGAVAALYNQGLTLTFTHVPTSYHVTFAAMLTSFDDSFNAEFQGTKVYGRMDQIAVYTGTTRLINFSFDIVANSQEDAFFNLGKISRLESFMYPAYDGDGKTGTNTISAAPLMRIKFGNLIQSSNNDGLLGYINVVNTAPNFEHGFLIEEDGAMYPKAYTMNITFNVLHEHELGWYKDGANWKWRGDKNGQYPYNNNLPDGDYWQRPAGSAPTLAEVNETNNQTNRPDDDQNADGASPDSKNRKADKIKQAKKLKAVGSAMNPMGFGRGGPYMTDGS
jgi:hypothetical protein